MSDEEQKKDAPKEEKKPRRRRKAPDEGGEKPARAEKAESAEEPEAKAEEKPEADDAEKKPARRRGSAETTTATEPKRPAPRRDGDGAVLVRAHAKYVRSAPRKARLVMNHIRGKPVAQARAILRHAPRAVSSDIQKLLDSAVANAENNHELTADELRIDRAFVDEGPTIRRYRPRALGRATRINKRTSHMTIELTTSADTAAGRS
jgi:large subunit ribosomal protein L22